MIGGGTNQRGGALLLPVLALICALGPVLESSRAASAADSFFMGSQAYVAGDYPLAATFYRQAAADAPAPGVWHNLGNAEWHCGHPGEAILAWERAQWLDPFNANTRANLRYARKMAHLDGPNLAWYEVYSAWLPASAWAVITTASFWIAVALITVPGWMRWRKADWPQGFAAVGFTLFLLTTPALIGVSTRSQVGVVLIDQAPLRLTPTHDAQWLAKLAAGESARRERERGDYVYIRVNNESAGWIQRAQFSPICELRPRVQTGSSSPGMDTGGTGNRSTR